MNTQNLAFSEQIFFDVFFGMTLRVDFVGWPFQFVNLIKRDSFFGFETKLKKCQSDFLHRKCRLSSAQAKINIFWTF